MGFFVTSLYNLKLTGVLIHSDTFLASKVSLVKPY